jgi:hypothetical protein
MPPVALPIITIREFTGDTAMELTRPLVSPHANDQVDTVGEGPIGRHIWTAWGTTLSSSNLG